MPPKRRHEDEDPAASPLAHKKSKRDQDGSAESLGGLRLSNEVNRRPGVPSQHFRLDADRLFIRMLTEAVTLRRVLKDENFKRYNCEVDLRSVRGRLVKITHDLHPSLWAESRLYAEISRERKLCHAALVMCNEAERIENLLDDGMLRLYAEAQPLVTQNLVLTGFSHEGSAEILDIIRDHTTALRSQSELNAQIQRAQRKLEAYEHNTHSPDCDSCLDEVLRLQDICTRLQREKVKIWEDHYDQPELLLILADKALMAQGAIPAWDSCMCKACNDRRQRDEMLQDSNPPSEDSQSDDGEAESERIFSDHGGDQSQLHSDGGSGFGPENDDYHADSPQYEENSGHYLSDGNDSSNDSRGDGASGYASDYPTETTGRLGSLLTMMAITTTMKMRTITAKMVV